MQNNTQILREMSIAKIYNGDMVTFEVPIYQRNYAWEKDEIAALIQDVYDAYDAKKQVYYIGTLVTFHKGDQIYEVIDGQQRLTTINLVLGAMGVTFENKLTYRARKKSSDTLRGIPEFKVDEKDYGIIRGFKFAQEAISEIVPNGLDNDGFKKYFMNNVHLIHYQVPKDIDLNHYFEIMNSRGEQLEKHEIIKARLIQMLNKADAPKFSRLWDACSDMTVYVQEKYNETVIYSKDISKFAIDNFDALPGVDDNTRTISITDLITNECAGNTQKEDKKLDTFQPIIDFSNFLLIVLKLTLIEQDNEFVPTEFNLDDKDLIREFDKVKDRGLLNVEFVKQFGYNLIKAKFLLDNYLVHHSLEDDTIDSNPWKLDHLKKDDAKEDENKPASDTKLKLTQLLSMFEVSFSAKQRKNYLLYCLLYLFRSESWDISGYCEFVSKLAEKYFKDVYLDPERLSDNNTPISGAFDKVILVGKIPDVIPQNCTINFNAVYGDGTGISKRIPHFVFNYLDYKLWEKYLIDLRGQGAKEGDNKRVDFFNKLGCSDFGLELFDRFYFSRTRRSLEHFFPQANATGQNGAPNEEQINCFGNFALIGSEANSSGSNWSPKVKLDHYLDTSSGKIRLVSVASIKFMIMMQKCKDNEKDMIIKKDNLITEREKSNFDNQAVWNFEHIKEHQEKMIEIFLGA
jgi:hypothetical protein